MRTGLDRLCSSCRLRLASAKCPFCRNATSATKHEDGQLPLARSSRALIAPGRFLRWFFLVGGLALVPMPLLVPLAPLLALGSGESEPSELVLHSAVAGPGLFLAAMLIIPGVLAVLPLPFAAILGIVEAARRFRRVGVRALGESLESSPDRLDHRLGQLQQLVERVGHWTSNRNVGIGVASFAVLLVGLSFVIRDEDMLPWTAGLVGLFGAGVFFFALSVWVQLLSKGLEWIRKPPGLVADAAERGRRRLDRAREEAVTLERCSADREPMTGVITTTRPIRAPLAGTEVVAVRLWGRVGRWEVDDAFVSGDVTVRLDEGRDVEVRATDWLLPLDMSWPGPVERTPELDACLEELGVPSGTARLSEAVIRVGDRVTILADATREHAAGEGYRDGLRMVLTGEGDRPVMLAKA